MTKTDLVNYVAEEAGLTKAQAASALDAFICGVTEPFEFLFMYAAFPLYIIYSVLYGI